MRADVVELVYTLVLGTSVLSGMWVRLPPSAQQTKRQTGTRRGGRMVLHRLAKPRSSNGDAGSNPVFSSTHRLGGAAGPG